MTYGEQWDGPAEDGHAEDGHAKDVQAQQAIPGDAAADPRIAGALADLEGLADTPPDEHVEVYEQVHRVLQDALTDATGGEQSQRTGQPGGLRQ